MNQDTSKWRFEHFFLMTTDGKFIQITGQNIMTTKPIQMMVKKASLN